jgi:hypothetical protein
MIEIAEFRDFFRIDRVAWSKPYRIIDKELRGLDENEISTEWPSQYLSKDAVKEKLDIIHSKFIHNDAPYQICFPHVVLERTTERIKRVNIYGPQTFEESLVDPLKTLKRDILPRFLRSHFFATMNTRLESIQRLPSAGDLATPIPPSRLSFNLEELPHDRRFHLKEVVDNRYLYQEFLKYTQKCFCSENLICYRMVTLFEERIEAKEPCEDLAWDIFRYFVAEGSAYEISIEFAKRKAIMLELAKPKHDTFEFVKKSSLNVRSLFNIIVC